MDNSMNFTFSKMSNSVDKGLNSPSALTSQLISIKNENEDGSKLELAQATPKLNSSHLQAYRLSDTPKLITNRKRTLASKTTSISCRQRSRLSVGSRAYLRLLVRWSTMASRTTRVSRSYRVWPTRTARNNSNKLIAIGVRILGSALVAFSDGFRKAWRVSQMEALHYRPRAKNTS